MSDPATHLMSYKERMEKFAFDGGTVDEAICYLSECLLRVRNNYYIKEALQLLLGIDDDSHIRVPYVSWDAMTRECSLVLEVYRGKEAERVIYQGDGWVCREPIPFMPLEEEKPEPNYFTITMEFD